jgi:uncharacterized membrane protein
MSEPTNQDLAPELPATEPRAEISDTSRWLAALSYAFVLALFVVYETKRRPPDVYVRFHARQGFVLFFVEFALLVVSMILDRTVGKVDYVGFVFMTTWNLVLGLLAVGVSVMGFMYGLSGERWEMPVLGRFADRVPLR